MIARLRWPCWHMHVKKNPLVSSRARLHVRRVDACMYTRLCFARLLLLRGISANRIFVFDTLEKLRSNPRSRSEPSVL